MSVKHENLKKVAMIKLSKAGCLALEIKPGIYRDIHTKGIVNLMSQQGCPDVIYCSPTGAFGGMEIKIGKDTLRPAQKNFQQQLEQRGARYDVVRTENDIDEITIKIR